VDNGPIVPVAALVGDNGKGIDTAFFAEGLGPRQLAFWHTRFPSGVAVEHDHVAIAAKTVDALTGFCQHLNVVVEGDLVGVMRFR